ncbi:hypothetical protein B0T25DRAFT_574665 [Lasiosphaeria hispida]|uniref:Uncharacterized protein n=1 Tax=Lasiosphaeria hispida TaxID=260671 RepID=A0AAJ0H5M0_9PEZI|nr:hypothetical protein B0T25DRAFT_574665 [Lasiosphaeria hispida]
MPDRYSNYKPSDLERDQYYYGLPTDPRLVARTSYEVPWEPKVAGTYTVAKHLSNVGRHEIVDKYDDSISRDIISSLNSNGTPWTCIDVVRIGETMTDADPMILWIGVSPGSTTPGDALRRVLFFLPGAKSWCSF